MQSVMGEAESRTYQDMNKGMTYNLNVTSEMAVSPALYYHLVSICCVGCLVTPWEACFFFQDLSILAL